MLLFLKCDCNKTNLTWQCLKLCCSLQYYIYTNMYALDPTPYATFATTQLE